MWFIYMYVIIIKITILSMSNKPKLKYYPYLLYKIKNTKFFLEGTMFMKRN